MPVIKVWCLPSGQTEAYLNRLHGEIVAAVISVAELGLHSEKDMTCLYPPDLMKYGLGEEIIVEISGLFEKPERTKDVLQRLAKKVGEVVMDLYPEARAECFVTTVDPFQGFWSGAKKVGNFTVTCPSCGKRISSQDNSCPECDFPKAGRLSKEFNEYFVENPQEILKLNPSFDYLCGFCLNHLSLPEKFDLNFQAELIRIEKEVGYAVRFFILCGYCETTIFRTTIASDE